MPDDKLAELLKRYAEGKCNEDEKRLVEEWFEKYKTNERHVPLNSEGKDAMFRSQDMALADALDYLRSQLTLALSTEDIQEGVRAFFEKREPQWRGR